jgi:SHS2 domain-containing protein
MKYALLGGDSAGEAFANAVVCMFGYMTELEYVDIDPTINKEVQVEGEALYKLLRYLLIC